MFCLGLGSSFVSKIFKAPGKNIMKIIRKKEVICRRTQSSRKPEAHTCKETCGWSFIYRQQLKSVRICWPGSGTIQGGGHKSWSTTTVNELSRYLRMFRWSELVRQKDWLMERKLQSSCLSSESPKQCLLWHEKGRVGWTLPSSHLNCFRVRSSWSFGNCFKNDRRVMWGAVVR